MVFITVLLIAFTGNIITYKVGIDNGLELFYISPYHVPVLPVFDIIYNHVPYIVFLIIYIVVFSLGSLIPYGIIELIKKYTHKLK